MYKPTSTNSPLIPPLLNVKNNKIIVKSTFSTSIGRHAADNLEVNDFIDLTDDDQRCFICDKVITRAFYSLAKTVTNTSKMHIAQKLGELVGKSCIVVVSEDDYVCQSCINLFNRLDSLEIELRNVTTSILKHLEHTYFNEKKQTSTLPNHMYKALQLLINKEKKDSAPLLKKRKRSESQNILRDCLQSSNLQQRTFTETQISTERSTQAVSSQHYNHLVATNINCFTAGSSKENIISHQQNITKNVYSSNIKNNVNVPAYLLSKQNDMHTMKSIKIDHQNGTTIIERNLALSNTKMSIYSNEIKNSSQIVQPATILETGKDLLLGITCNPLQSSPQMFFFTEDRNLNVTHF